MSGVSIWEVILSALTSAPVLALVFMLQIRDLVQRQRSTGGDLAGRLP